MPHRDNHANGTPARRFTLSPTDAGSLDRVSTFLRRAFGAAPDAAWCAAATLHWKYFAWPGPYAATAPLSYLALDEDGEIVGHIGMTRRALRLSGAADVVVGAHFTDWTALPTSAGAGAFLLLRGLGTSPIAYTLGGSEDGKRISEAARFERRTPFPVFRRVLAPAYRLRQRGHPWWRRAAGSAREATRRWSSSSTGPATAVTLDPVDTFGDEVRDVLAGAARFVSCSERSAGLLNHYLRCPVGEVTGYHLRGPGGARLGLGVLTVVTLAGVRHGRIIDCLLADERPDDWCGAMRALVAELGRRGADVVTCYASTPLMHQACVAAGMYIERLQSVMIRDRRGLTTHAQFHFTHLEADHALF